MAEIAHEVMTIKIDYICDKCQKGTMIFTQQGKPGIQKGDVLLVHKCIACGHVQEFKNTNYPRVEYVPVRQLQKKKDVDAKGEKSNEQSENESKKILKPDFNKLRESKEKQ